MDEEKKGSGVSSIWKTLHHMENVSEHGGGKTHPYSGLNRSLPPENTKVLHGVAAESLLAETLELERERRRVRVEGPKPPDQK